MAINLLQFIVKKFIKTFCRAEFLFILEFWKIPSRQSENLEEISMKMVENFIK